MRLLVAVWFNFSYLWLFDDWVCLRITVFVDFSLFGFDLILLLVYICMISFGLNVLFICMFVLNLLEWCCVVYDVFCCMISVIFDALICLILICLFGLFGLFVIVFLFIACCYVVSINLLDCLCFALLFCACVLCWFDFLAVCLIYIVFDLMLLFWFVFCLLWCFACWLVIYFGFLFLFMLLWVWFVFFVDCLFWLRMLVWGGWFVFTYLFCFGFDLWLLCV